MGETVAASSTRAFLAVGAGVTAVGEEATSQPRTSRRLRGNVSASLKSRDGGKRTSCRRASPRCTASAAARRRRRRSGRLRRRRRSARRTRCPRRPTARRCFEGRVLAFRFWLRAVLLALTCSASCRPPAPETAPATSLRERLCRQGAKRQTFRHSGVSVPLCAALMPPAVRVAMRACGRCVTRSGEARWLQTSKGPFAVGAAPLRTASSPLLRA
jgi:hypothetical protein